MVEWLAPTFNQHKKRLFGAVRASHQSELYLNKMRKKHSSGNFPSFIESLTGPKALNGLSFLQPVWDQIHSQYKEFLYQCYDPGSSLCKRNDLQGKDGSTLVLQYLTNGSAWTDAKGNVSGARTGGFKGQLLMVAVEVGTKDTGSNGY